MSCSWHSYVSGAQRAGESGVVISPGLWIQIGIEYERNILASLSGSLFPLLLFVCSFPDSPNYLSVHVTSDLIIGQVITIGIQSFDNPRCAVSYSLDRLVIFSERGLLITERRPGINPTIG